MKHTITLSEAMALVSWSRTRYFVPIEKYLEVRQSLLEGLMPWGDQFFVLDERGRSIGMSCDALHSQIEFYRRHADLFSKKQPKSEQAIGSEVQEELGLELFSPTSVVEQEKTAFHLQSYHQSLWLKLFKELSMLKAQGLKVCVQHQQEYPAQLKKMRYPPWVLSYAGDISILSRSTLSAVGAREMSSHAHVWIESEFQNFLAKTQKVTISGGARGVDQAVHWQSIKLGLPTAVVLPSGLLRVYPKELNPWLPKIISAGGLVLTEFSPLQEMRKWNFFLRNRIIASASDLLFLVQAQKRSGSWSTVNWALEEGREIVALSSFPGVAAFSGNISLIKMGVSPIFDHEDLITLSKSRTESSVNFM